ncbi:unnamed protein product [Brassicogethes aeneus]|uniref:Sodium/potassium-transporting ATPase subunit beta-2 n=1 Tax=Brassicogethes aeneus TaxID=1431903 RepID=A0A9P0B819_BRAAE|nr:unnamed protein product [Brassicogethes aeneus]
MADKKDQFYTRPPKLGKWEGFRQFLWNSETGQFMGRTGSSWGKILLFYFIFYAVLIGFFTALVAVFYQTLDPRTPKWQLDSSLIGSNPGLGFRPMPPESNVDSTLIWYKSSDKGNVQYWQRELNAFLTSYKKENNPHYNNVEQCNTFQRPSEGKVCDVNMNQQWSPCLQEMSYGFENDKSGPCIFLKLNKIYGWVPEYYNTSTLPQSDEAMPAYLKKVIVDAEKQQKHHMVWVTCEGENPADKENIGSIRFIPARGFPSQYFPFKNEYGYLSPLVAVYFEEPRRGVLINIECKAWAKNVHHDRVDRRGSVHFELMVD